MSTNIRTLSKAIRFSERSPKSFADVNASLDGFDSKITLWIQECILDIQGQIINSSNDINPSSFRGEGATMVTCIAYRKADGVYELTVVVARDYFSAVIEEFNPYDIPTFEVITNNNTATL